MSHAQLAIDHHLFDQQVIGTADANTREIHAAWIGGDVAHEILQGVRLQAGAHQQHHRHGADHANRREVSPRVKADIQIGCGGDDQIAVGGE
jgi:hypothetical protein